jgi:hypothetical protein
MTEEADNTPTADRGDPLARSLRRLTEGFGIRSTTLRADLGPELRQLFHVPEWDADPLRTLARVTWQLDRLITAQLVGEDLQQAARVSYNLGTADTQRMKLGERRNWLYLAKHGPSPSESQRDLRNVVVPAFVASLRSEPPPRPADEEIAALMAIETGPIGVGLLAAPERTTSGNWTASS